MQCLEQELLSCMAASQLMLMKNTLEQLLIHCRLVFLWFFSRLFFSAAGDFLPDGGSDTAGQCTLQLPTVDCTVDLGTCNCFEKAPSDFPVFFKSITGSFRSVLSSLNFHIVVFIAESSRCICHDIHVLIYLQLNLSPLMCCRWGLLLFSFRIIYLGY